jgi:single-strand DNA-binding protein
MNINNVVITGNLTRDPELRTIPSGTSVCELGVAVNERVKDSSGAWTDRANFFNVTVWGKSAENCAQYLSKGRGVAVSGRLRWESWEKDGQKRSAVKIVADMVQFLGDGKGSSSSSGSEAAGGDFGAPAAAGGDFGVPAGQDDDIPF